MRCWVVLQDGPGCCGPDTWTAVVGVYIREEDAEALLDNTQNYIKEAELVGVTEGDEPVCPGGC